MADRINQRALFPLAVLSAMLILFMTSANGYDVRFEDREFKKRWHMARRNYCVDSAGKCFSSGQCCDGLICAAFDDYYGQKPEVPGYCVKEKDLEACVTEGDCRMGSRCVELGRTGESYCLPRTGHQAYQAHAPLLRTYVPSDLADKEEQVITGGDKGMGQDCTTSADCKPVSDYSQEKLCCQDVRRSRQGVKRQCSSIISTSICL